MLGAIIGDIVGSIYEFDNVKTKDFPLFQDDSQITDDTVCTIAVADIILNDKDPVEIMLYWCRKYPGMGYGERFTKWFDLPWQEPYNSYGNGAAMRVSPVAWLAKTLDQALASSDRVTEITHNHPEGIKGARATAHAIYLAKSGSTAQDIRSTIAVTYNYDMSKSVDEIRENYSFYESCQQTVPQALTCALEANDFENAIRNAIWIGGDSDTIGAIAGSLAEALFGIPAQIRARAEAYIPSDMWSILVPFFDAAGFRAGQVWTCKKSNFLFLYKCPKYWGFLKTTGNPDVRYCDKCQENVYFCATPEEYVRFSKESKCVAINIDVVPRKPRDESTVYLGRPPKEMELAKIKAWWKEVDFREKSS